MNKRVKKDISSLHFFAYLLRSNSCRNRRSWSVENEVRGRLSPSSLLLLFRFAFRTRGPDGKIKIVG